jgi:hypothetical protein
MGQLSIDWSALSQFLTSARATFRDAAATHPNHQPAGLGQVGSDDRFPAAGRVASVLPFSGIISAGPVLAERSRCAPLAQDEMARCSCFLGCWS